MPARWFRCPDGKEIEIEECLQLGGCRLKKRCASRPFLRLIGYDRKWKGVTPSAAGNGPRLLYLKATTDYLIDPNDRVWSAFGIGTHGRLSLHKYTFDVLAEEPLKDRDIEGIPDCLDESETRPGYFDLVDYKTWGSYKLLKALGGDYAEVLDDEGNPVLYVRGKNKGKPKKEYQLFLKEPDLRAEELQLNRYRILFEDYGFKIDRLLIQAIPRDGGTQIARSRKILRNLYMIPVKKLSNSYVLNFYKKLGEEVEKGFRIDYVRKCNDWESWDGRRCDGYCEVAEKCKEMDKEFSIYATRGGIKWKRQKN